MSRDISQKPGYFTEHSGGLALLEPCPGVFLLQLMPVSGDGTQKPPAFIQRLLQVGVNRAIELP